MSELILIFLVLVVFLLLKGFFSGSEIALVSSDKIKLRHKARQGSKGARLALKLFETPDLLLGTTLVGNNISTVVFTTIGTVLMINLLGPSGDLWAFLLFTPILLVLGEVVPKSVYQHESNQLAPIIILPLRWFSYLFYPIIFIFSRVARQAARLVGGGRSDQNVFITREQLRSILEMAERGSNVDSFDRARVRRAIRFSETLVGEAMVPMGEMVTIDSQSDTTEAISLVRRFGFNRMPVHKGNSGDIIGIATLDTWDLMDEGLSDKSFKDLIKPAHFVSPLQTIDQLLPILRNRSDHMAIVVDEFGSAVGMITMEDIIEEVVGEIDVGYDFEEYLPRRRRIVEMLEEDVYLMDARMPLSEASDVLGIHIPNVEAHTLGGLMASHLRRIPMKGESVVEAGYRFTVAEANEKAALKLRVEADAGMPEKPE
jgi:CBS domain containing-hemolysin-like protein